MCDNIGTSTKMMHSTDWEFTLMPMERSTLDNSSMENLRDLESSILMEKSSKMASGR